MCCPCVRKECKLAGLISGLFGELALEILMSRESAAISGYKRSSHADQFVDLKLC